MLSSDNKGGAGGLADASDRNVDDICASKLADAAEHVDEMTVFEQRRLLRLAADEIWKRRETIGFCGRRLAGGPNDLADELRLMAEHILRTPHPLLRLAFREAALALREFEGMNSGAPVAH